MSVQSRLNALEKRVPSENECPVCGLDRRIALILSCPQPEGSPKGPACGHLVIQDPS